MDLKELQAKTVPDVEKAIPDLSDDQLAELLVLEKADDKPRVGVTGAIEAEQMARMQKLEDAARETAEAAAREQAEAEAAEAAAAAAAAELAAAQATATTAPPTGQSYRDPEYLGPLTGAQAQWRLANLKPVTAEGVITK